MSAHELITDHLELWTRSRHPEIYGGPGKQRQD